MLTFHKSSNPIPAAWQNVWRPLQFIKSAHTLCIVNYRWDWWWVDWLLHSLPLCRVSEDDGKCPVMWLYIPLGPLLKENRKQTVWWKFWLISECYETLHNYKYDVVSEASKCKQVIYLHPHPPSPSHMKPLGLVRISINICSNLLRRRLFPPSFSQPPSCPLGSCCFSRNATPPSSNPHPPPPRPQN